MQGVWGRVVFHWNTKNINYPELAVWSLFFPIAVVYLELVFVFSTDIAFDPWLVAGILISGAMSGCLMHLLSSLFSQHKPSPFAFIHLLRSTGESCQPIRFVPLYFFNYKQNIGYFKHGYARLWRNMNGYEWNADRAEAESK